ncbi:MAG: amino acid ABC transporter substrate-binding protein [Clostridia bacterium]|nr:amino acid ABC transporter substrate-binding protein [Clostridia bacterium]MBQ8136820.1 amino acid ABC transporter substrate-binding protein [Clostridia bacterium]
MKKLTAIILSLMLILSLGAASARTLDEIKADGTIVIGTSPDFPPYENLVLNPATGEFEILGIEMDIWNLLSEKLGLKLDIRQMDFDSILGYVQTGTFDVGVSGFTVTETRKQNTLFSDVYCYEKQVIVVVEGSEISGIADLEGKLIAVQSGTTAEVNCLENNYTISAYKYNQDAEMALARGSVDAWIVDAATGMKLIAEYNAANEKKLVVLDEPLTNEPYAFAFALGNDDLAAFVNEALNELIDNGAIAEIFAANDTAYLSPRDAE